MLETWWTHGEENTEVKLTLHVLIKITNEQINIKQFTRRLHRRINGWQVSGYETTMYTLTCTSTCWNFQNVSEQ